MPQMEALMSLTKIYIAIAVSAALAASSTGCRQFKELVNEEPKTQTTQVQKSSIQEEEQPLILQNSSLNEVERAEIEAMYGDREAERKARRKRVFEF